MHIISHAHSALARNNNVIRHHGAITVIYRNHLDFGPLAGPSTMAKTDTNGRSNMLFSLSMLTSSEINEDEDEEYSAINSEVDDYDDDMILLHSKAKQHKYKPPIHSQSFIEHLESVKSSWPRDYDSTVDASSDGGDCDQKEKYISDIDDYGGVYCVGEPSIDPSRVLDSTIVDGESNWI